jgi:hypothetical protein
MSTGGGYTPVVVLARKSFQLTQGTLVHYTTDSIKGDGNKRGFCGTCGSRITGAESERIIAVTASSLDDPSIFKAQFDIFTSHAQPWDTMDPSLPKYDQYMPKP